MLYMFQVYLLFAIPIFVVAGVVIVSVALLHWLSEMTSTVFVKAVRGFLKP